MKGTGTHMNIPLGIPQTKNYNKNIKLYKNVCIVRYIHSPCLQSIPSQPGPHPSEPQSPVRSSHDADCEAQCLRLQFLLQFIP